MEHSHVLTCVAPHGLSAEFQAELRELLAAHALTLDGTTPLSPAPPVALDVRLSGDVTALRPHLEALAARYHTDVACLRVPADRSAKRLVVFDMDSTLVNAEVIDELAEVAGVGAAVKAITARAMNGELNFDQSLTERVALLRGLSRSALEAVHARLPLNPGVARCLKELHQRGIKTAIVSGGFTLFAEALRADLGMHYCVANELEFAGDALTGRVAGAILNADGKARTLDELARREGLELSQVVAVGDGANDIPMLARAGLGVAYHAKPKVRAAARIQLTHGPMTTLLYFLGIHGSHFDGTV